MARKEDNCCNGCPECRGCGRDTQYYVYWKCDICGFESDEESDFESDNFGMDICKNCYESEG